jgi:hypothetical protein
MPSFFAPFGVTIGEHPIDQSARSDKNGRTGKLYLLPGCFKRLARFQVMKTWEVMWRGKWNGMAADSSDKAKPGSQWRKSL